MTQEVTEKPKKRPIQKKIQKPKRIAKQKTLILVPRGSNSPNAKYPNLGDDFVPFDEEGNRFVTQIVQVGKLLTYHGDLLIGNAKELPKIKAKGFLKMPPPKKWPEGKIPYVIDENLSNYDKVLEAIDYVHNFTNVRFIPREEQPNFVRFTYGEQDCYSYVGMTGIEQEIFLSPRCDVREIIHEITHTMGFFHEQNREDRDDFIEVLWDNIDEVNHTQFKKIPNDFLGITQRDFDIESIMMYSSFTFAVSSNEPAMLTQGGDIIPQNSSLFSDEDIERINLAYPEN
ncbi:MAG: hypothetical protein HRT44_10885 [Bdellovibrionales bacterium]|nr:hypothetical protein [Bdellovibrionales bacterium]